MHQIHAYALLVALVGAVVFIARARLVAGGDWD
jgi:uncharacterized membrane protein YeaQ/YmgE (transglycosylase-associated protein family)